MRLPTWVFTVMMMLLVLASAVCAGWKWDNMPMH